MVVGARVLVCDTTLPPAWESCRRQIIEKPVQQINPDSIKANRRPSRERTPALGYIASNSMGPPDAATRAMRPGSGSKVRYLLSAEPHHGHPHAKGLFRQLPQITA